MNFSIFITITIKSKACATCCKKEWRILTAFASMIEREMARKSRSMWREFQFCTSQEEKLFSTDPKSLAGNLDSIFFS